jgi:GGDEF domain-containing protein
VDTGSSITLDPWVLAGLLACAFLLGSLIAAPGARIGRRMSEWRAGRSGEPARDRLIEQLRRSQAFAVHTSALGPYSPTPPGGDIMLRADIESLASIQRIWGEAARASATSQVAGLLRGSVRTRSVKRPTARDTVRIIPGEGFVIILRAPGEGAGTRIARRLSSLLADMPIEGLENDIRLSASFGIAERRPGERYAAWRKRAEHALSAAKARGESEIVTAQLATEPILLPPPLSGKEGSIDSAAATTARA